jgi:flagellar protein FlaJ
MIAVAIFIVLNHNSKKPFKVMRTISIMKRLRHVRPGQQPLKIVRITNDAIVSLVKPATNQKPVVAIQSMISNILACLIRGSGKTANPKLLAVQSTSYMVFSCIVVVPASVALGIVFDRLFFVLLAIPLCILLLPLMRLWAYGSERKTAIEDEIAFFSAYGSVMQTVGRTLYASIFQIIGKKIFPIIESDARMLKRDMVLFGMEQSSALNSLAISHPNTKFRNLLLGYVSIQKSGGDLGRYMELKNEEFFNDMKFRFFKYASSAETVAESALILLGILPVLLVMSSFLITQDSLRIMTSLSFVAIPAITAALVLVTNNIQPKSRDDVGFCLPCLAVGTISGSAGFFLVQEVWFSLAVAIFASTATNFIFLSRQFAEITMTENALASFFRDITEHRKIGHDIPNSIIHISKERTYNWFFDDILFAISSKISYGVDLGVVIDSLRIRSWHAKVAFFILSKISESGGGTPQILEQMTNFTTKITQAKNEMVSRVKVFTFLAYGSPLLMTWSSQAMKGLLEKITPEYARLMNVVGSDLVVSAEFLQMVNLLTVISSLCIGMIMAKITHFTTKHTLTVAITSAIAIISVYLIPVFPSW